jgi:hypothetical protein
VERSATGGHDIRAVFRSDATVGAAEAIDDGNTSRWLGRKRPIHLEVIPSPRIINLASSGHDDCDSWNQATR